MKKIDIHLHLVFDGLSDDQNADGREMKQYFETHEVEHGVLMSCGEFETPLGVSGSGDLSKNGNNLECCALAQKYPKTFSWMCNLDPEYKPETLAERMWHYKALGAVGVGEFFYNYWLDHPRIMAVMEAAQETELPVLFHISPLQGFQYGIADDAGLPRLEKVLRAFPELVFIGHSQPFWYEISGDMPGDLQSRNSYPSGKVKAGGRLIQLLDEFPNLCADLSANSAGNAIMRDPDFGFWFLNQYQDRLMYGTDMCNTGMYFPLYDFMEDGMKKGYLSKEVLSKICFDNANRILKLGLE